MKQLATITLVLLIAISLAVFPVLSQTTSLVVAQSQGMAAGEQAGRGGNTFWAGFWAGLTGSSYEIIFTQMPAMELQKLSDKPAGYAAAYILGYQIGYRDAGNKSAGMGKLVGQVTLVGTALLILSLSSSAGY
jgi:hypothetical protein